MTHPALTDFIDRCASLARAQTEPADCVLVLAPLMLELIGQAPQFLTAAHRRSEPGHYARNLVHAAADDSLSLYALVWQPGQWTPVHDHGSWGVVGVVEGVLEERSYVRLDADRGATPGTDSGVQLARGGTILIAPGSVTSFVPNPDHIHMTGVPDGRAPVLSLHLYGRMMSDFNTYDVAAGTRKRVRVEHNES